MKQGLEHSSLSLLRVTVNPNLYLTLSDMKRVYRRNWRLCKLLKLFDLCTPNTVVGEDVPCYNSNCENILNSLFSHLGKIKYFFFYFGNFPQGEGKMTSFVSFLLWMSCVLFFLFSSLSCAQKRYRQRVPRYFSLPVADSSLIKAPIVRMTTCLHRENSSAVNMPCPSLLQGGGKVASAVTWRWGYAELITQIWES